MHVGALELWNHRSMQILVLLSLGLQFVLYILAGIRRRENAPVRRLLLWLAYLMADSTAVYALGHL
jgi:cytochrome c oxidase assembly factor CtaG